MKKCVDFQVNTANEPFTSVDNDQESVNAYNVTATLDDPIDFSQIRDIFQYDSPDNSNNRNVHMFTTQRNIAILRESSSMNKPSAHNMREESLEYDDDFQNEVFQ